MTSPQIALVRLLLEGAPLPEVGPIAELVQAHPERVAQARALIASGVEAPDTVAGARALFDRLAAEAPEAGVALYSLGDAALLDRATREIVDVVEDWVPLTPATRMLDFGCGIGRVTREMAARGVKTVGIDVSEGMIAEARRRGGASRYLVGDGRGLGEIPDSSFDLVLAADSFPYLVAAGEALLADHVRECARVLTPEGSLIVFNWSYRGDPAKDAAEAERLGAEAGFAVVRSGETPFAIWDAAGFHLVNRR